MVEAKQIAALTTLFQAAIAAADPLLCVPPFLPERPKGKLIVVGAGKASARMAEAVEAHYGEPLTGLVITRYGHERPTQYIEIAEAAHPVPDAAGVTATKRVLELTRNLTKDDVVLTLISGGGSALFCAPIDGMTLEQKQELNAQLLASGAPIAAMNEIRRYFSQVKGGRFAQHCAPAQICTLMISDVPGDDMSIIASGPTVAPNQPAASLRALLAQWAIEVPEELMEAAERRAAQPTPACSATNQIIAAPSRSLDAAKAEAEAMGFDVQILGDAIEGEARKVGTQHARLAIEMQAKRTADAKPLVLLSGGECTVRPRGDGVGGPNAEYALGALDTLKGAAGIFVLAADTDGVDGVAEVAGAFATPNGYKEAKKQSLSPQDYLTRNDAHRFFERIQAQLITGPTLTNVNDFRAIMIYPKN